MSRDEILLDTISMANTGCNPTQPDRKPVHARQQHTTNLPNKLKSIKQFKQMARHSKSQRAGIQFPAARIERQLRRTTLLRVSLNAGVYLAGILEYLTRELLELSGNYAHDAKRKRINPSHLAACIRYDEELEKLCLGTTIAGTICFIGIPPQFLPEKRIKKETRADTIARQREALQIAKDQNPLATRLIDEVFNNSPNPKDDDEWRRFNDAIARIQASHLTHADAILDDDGVEQSRQV